MLGMEEIYKNLISSWREAYDGLTAEEKTRIQYIDDLRPPCQIMAVILENKKLRVKQQLLVISHFKDESDCDIKVIGPIDSLEAGDRLLEVVKEKRFERPLPQKTFFPYVKTYSELVQNHLLSLIGSFRNLVIKNVWTGQLPEVGAGVGAKHLLSEKVSVWEFIGMLDNKRIKSIVDSSMESIKREVRRKGKVQAPKEAQKRKEIKAHGTFIYPHLWVGSRPTHTFEEDMRNVMYDMKSYRPIIEKAVVFERIGGLTWLATQEGLIAVVVADKILAIRFLNAFMSLLILQGTPAFVARENELMEMTLDPDTGKVLGSQSAIVLPRMLPRDPSFVRTRWQEEFMPVVKISTIKQIWKGIGKIADNDTALNTLRIFGEVYTHFHRDEYSQAILLAWIMVEKWYESSKEEISKVEKIPKRRGIGRKKDIVKLLETESKMSSDIISKVYQLRLLRNQVIHAMGSATKEDAKLALETVIAIIQTGQS